MYTRVSTKKDTNLLSESNRQSEREALLSAESEGEERGTCNDLEC